MPGNYRRFPPSVSPVCPRPREHRAVLAEAALPKLTKRFVDALKPVTRDTLYRDDDLAGFGLRAKPSGVCTWVVQYRNLTGRTRKLALGRVGVLTPDEARREARIALGRVAAGEDPSATRNAARGAMTVADLCKDYLAAAEKGLVLGKGKRRKAEFTLADDRSRIAMHIVPQLGAMSSSRRDASRCAAINARHSDRQDGRRFEIGNRPQGPRNGWHRFGIPYRGLAGRNF